MNKTLVMQNPWKQIPFEDYEGHMSHSSVGQLKILGDITRDALEKYMPGVFVLLGACTGNGLEYIDVQHTRKVVCVDINKNYLDVAHDRFGEKIPDLQLICADLNYEEPEIKDGDLVMAALLFEYVDPARLMKIISGMLSPGGVARIVIQQSTPGAFVSNTSYTSLSPLKDISRELCETEIMAMASDNGLDLIFKQYLQLSEYKKFIVTDFGLKKQN